MVRSCSTLQALTKRMIIVWPLALLEGFWEVDVVWRLSEGQALSDLLWVFEESLLSRGQQEEHPFHSGIYFLEAWPCSGLAQLQAEIWGCSGSGFGTASGRGWNDLPWTNAALCAWISNVESAVGRGSVKNASVWTKAGVYRDFKPCMVL